MISIAQLIQSRVSVNLFDATRGLSVAQITELARLATRSPSSFNVQNWRLVAVRTPEAKERLKKLAYGQQKVTDAAVTFIVCGALEAHEILPRSLQPSIDAGVITQKVADGWISAARKAYGTNPQFQRDEAIRSASMAAMTLMLAAEGMGLASGPMIGFDAAGVAREFGLAPTEVPAMLVTVGYAAPGNTGQKPRRPLSETLAIV